MTPTRLNIILGTLLASACLMIIGLSVHIIHHNEYHHEPALTTQSVPYYCQSLEALKKFQEDNPTLGVICNNDPE